MQLFVPYLLNDLFLQTPTLHDTNLRWLVRLVDLI